MLEWFTANLINLILIAVITGVVGLLIRSMIRDRKAGKHACGGSCSCCAGCSACGGCKGSTAQAEKQVLPDRNLSRT